MLNKKWIYYNLIINNLDKINYNLFITELILMLDNTNFIIMFLDKFLDKIIDTIDTPIKKQNIFLNYNYIILICQSIIFLK